MIKLKDVTKKFDINKNPKTALQWFSKEDLLPKELIALNKINLSIKEGEIVGLIGENGSGKTTLLKTISRVYEKNDGEIMTKGKIISIIGTPFKEELTMKENIFYISHLMGLDKKEIENKLKSIIEFSEIEKFLNTKMNKFSSGMINRIYFSIAIHANPKIMLLDEFFKPLDENFELKCLHKIKELSKESTSFIITSHDIGLLEKICDRILIIKKGEIVGEKVIER